MIRESTVIHAAYPECPRDGRRDRILHDKENPFLADRFRQVDSDRAMREESANEAFDVRTHQSRDLEPFRLDRGPPADDRGSTHAPRNIFARAATGEKGNRALAPSFLLSAAVADGSCEPAGVLLPGCSKAPPDGA